ncbi:MAG TPA: hypothetical protein VH370_12565 [Humisphaera sp.]|jgi:hypothetical protein|nr:hypothetical protein [Humisphaera sp.]
MIDPAGTAVMITRVGKDSSTFRIQNTAAKKHESNPIAQVAITNAAESSSADFDGDVFGGLA